MGRTENKVHLVDWLAKHTLNSVNTHTHTHTGRAMKIRVAFNYGVALNYGVGFNLKTMKFVRMLRHKRT